MDPYNRKVMKKKNIFKDDTPQCNNNNKSNLM